MKKLKVPDYTEIEKYTSFNFGFIENTTNVAMSLCQAGYYINIRRNGTSYTVDVYKIAKR